MITKGYSHKKHILYNIALIIFGLILLMFKCFNLKLLAFLGTIPLFLGSYSLTLYYFGFYSLRPKYLRVNFLRFFEDLDCGKKEKILLLTEQKEQIKNILNILIDFPSKIILAVAEKNNIDYSHLIYADLNNLPFKEKSFDKLIIAGDSLHLEEAAKLVKKGGIIGIINLIKNFPEALKLYFWVFNAILPIKKTSIKGNFQILQNYNYLGFKYLILRKEE